MAVLNVDLAIVGAVLLALGVVAYILYRRREDLAVRTTAKVAIRKPVTQQAGKYHSVLVAFDVRGFTPQTIATASKLAARRQRAIHVLVTITVP
ncbi:MAG: universal stress protein UspA, partial [Chloroflexota bacterium]|nr:universal stress protein UspA [Chloroflexota bacterium]